MEQLLTIDEVAAYLQIPKSTIYKLSQKGVLPSSKIGKQLRFRKARLDQWLDQREAGTVAAQIPNTKQAKVVLLIEDDVLVLRTMVHFLRSKGYHVEPVQSGEDAVTKVQERDFDLVVSDVRMPGIDGIEALRQIREVRQKQNRTSIPEIVVTGYVDDTTEQRADQLGITDRLYKPFAIGEFMETVEKKLSLN